MLRHTLRRFPGTQAGRGTLILRMYPQQNRGKHDPEQLPVQEDRGLPAHSACAPGTGDQDHTWAQDCLWNLMAVRLKAELDRLLCKYPVPRDLAHMVVQCLPPEQGCTPAAAL